MLDDFPCIDFHLFKDVGLVCLSLDLDGFVYHFAQFSVALVELTVSLHKCFVSWSVGFVLILELKDFALEVSDLLSVLLFVLCELFVGPCKFVIDSVAFL